MYLSLFFFYFLYVILGALNEVLSMSNVEDGAMRLELRLISIRSLVLASMKVVQEQAERKGVVVLVEGLAGVASRPDIITEETEREDAKYMIRGDSMRLEHVLVHFLSNAIQNASLTTKASREDRPVVSFWGLFHTHRSISVSCILSHPSLTHIDMISTYLTHPLFLMHSLCR